MTNHAFHSGNNIAYARVEDVTSTANEETELAFAKAIHVKHTDDDNDADEDDAAIIVVVDNVNSVKSATAGNKNKKTPHTMASMDIGSEVEEETVPDHLVKGERQPNQYRDAWATVLFLLQCVGMVGVAIVYFPYIGQQQQQQQQKGAADADTDPTAAAAAAVNTDDSSASTGFDILFLLLIAFAIAGLTTMMTLFLMIRYSESLVKVSFSLHHLHSLESFSLHFPSVMNSTSPLPPLHSLVASRVSGVGSFTGNAFPLQPQTCVQHSRP